MSIDSLPLITITAAIPLVAAVVLWLLPATVARVARPIALTASLVTLGAGVVMVASFDTSQSATHQFVETYRWIEPIGASYAVGVDGVGLALVILSVLLVPLVILAAWKEHGGVTVGSGSRLRHYLALILVLETMMVLIFAARDVFLFYVVFEAMLIPVYFMIGLFGHGARRRYAAIKFLLFSLVGGLIMLIAMIALFITGPGGAEGFLISSLTGAVENPTLEKWIFLGFFIPFAIKAPMFPVHTWLPDTAQHAPAGTSVLLVGVLDKVGTFGMLTLCLPLFPNASQWAAPTIIILALISIIYGALLALGQRDLMRLIAYTSVSHFGFIVLGIFTFSSAGISGSAFYMVNHGLSTGLMFLVAGFLFLRSRSVTPQHIAEYGGMQRVTPVLAGVFLVAGLSALSMPGLSTFISEITVLIAAFDTSPWVAAIAALGVILAALYILLTYQRIFTGPPPASTEPTADLTVREKVVAAPLIAVMLLLGFLPGLALSYLSEPADVAVTTVQGGN